MAVKNFYYQKAFHLESGLTLKNLHLGYTTYGELNETKDNVVWIFHALTANSDPAEWWPGLVGKDKFFDASKYFIICVNMPGSHYGSFSPLSYDDTKFDFFYHNFPWFTVNDMVRSYQLLKKELGINKIHIAIGGSMGGQQALEWAIEEPDVIENLVLIATNAIHSPWGIAFNASQRLAIEADSTWKEKNPKAGAAGLKAARSIALLSYRHSITYNEAQQEENDNLPWAFKADTYQQYQGEKLLKRFNVFSYYFLTKSMDSHNVGRQRGGTKAALKKVKAKTLVVGIDTDILFPNEEQKFIAENISGGQFHVIHSQYGHDGFLLEYEQLTTILHRFLNTSKHLQTNTLQTL